MHEAHSARAADATTVDVLIVGAGFAGTAMGIQLLRAGRESFVIIEQADDVGGTWRDNRYPGVSCDLPSQLYSFSFQPNPSWSRVFAEGYEIHDYLRACIAEERLGDHMRLNCTLIIATWRDDEARRLVHTPARNLFAASLVLAAGRLSEPKLPAVENLEDFAGRWWHSAGGTKRSPSSAGGSASSAPALPRLRSCPTSRPRRAR
jgi:cation diffusion facilitator CzcD-associated flavoprotein CzcO